jgi:hypothetical protein
MAEDIPGLMSSTAVGRVGSDLPRRDHQPPARQRPQPPRRTAAPREMEESDGDEPRVVGSHLNVRA